MRRIAVWLVLVAAMLVPKGVGAQSSEYVIESFESKIILNQDTSLSIEERIRANFLVDKHGIYRVIPYSYVVKGKTLNTDVKILGVKNEKGENVKFSVDNYKQSKRLKIGDTDKTVLGEQVYIISYRVEDAVLVYEGKPEIYWNVVGAEWDTVINKANATVISEWAEAERTECFGGCEIKEVEGRVIFESEEVLGLGKDMTIVVGLRAENKLKFAGTSGKIIKTVRDNWGYGLALLPLVFMVWAWLKWGRDKRFLSENVFYKPDSKAEKKVGLLERPHLPMVYSPINGLSPVEVGVMVDEKLDIEDVVAEIVEMARLGFFKIEKIEKKAHQWRVKILGIKSNDYKLVRSEKSTEELRDYQKFLVEKLFGDKKEVKISELKNKFYIHLEDLRTKILDYLSEKQKALAGNIDKVRGKWVGIGILILGLGAGALMVTGTIEFNAGPLVVLGVTTLPVLVLAYFMPSKTAWGYSLHQQAVGLRWYLKKGKWREEIAEKNLFLEEMLPLAISLGVVDKLAKDMKDLGVGPPRYLGNATGSVWINDLVLFNSLVRSGITSAPNGQNRSGGWSYSGRSSWSGGSGFSGGSSGGGFGGGGGGSW